MDNSFPRIITLLRKEKKISQKQAALELGISQALLSHYEKGIRECGLDFLIRIAQFYNVTTDYLLGLSPDRSGTQLTVDDIPEANDVLGKENVFKGSMLPTLNRRLITNALGIIYDKLGKGGDKELTSEVSDFFMLAVYRVYRILYEANEANPDGAFSEQEVLARAKASAEMSICEAKMKITTSKMDTSAFNLAQAEVNEDYPKFAVSLYNLIKTCENKMTDKNEKSEKSK